MQDHDRIPEIALDWLGTGRRVAIATVIETWGSAPRPVGSMLAISDRAEMAGSVSGGCVEGAVVEEALAAIEDGTPRLLTYGVSDDDAFAVGLACGGTIRIKVVPVDYGETGADPGWLQALVAARQLAAQDAREKAEQLAALHGAQLGAVLEIAEEGGGGMAPLVKMMASEAHSPPIRTGTQRLGARLRVVYQLF